ncbi:MAG: maltose transporter periplasmic protein [Pseudomonadota bacterium]|jgi:maltose/maltodextrin transport system substrate-binding protein|nr:maltose/maltodextrin ABC transporter substrate-binding protein MalE [Betaproteobacteria bacterium]
MWPLNALWPRETVTPLGRRAAAAGIAASVWAMAWAPAPQAQAADAAASPSLLVWINGDKGYNGLQKVGDAFEKASGVKVVVQHPEGAPDKFQAAAGAGKGPDIICWPHDRVGEWAKSGLIVPVQPPSRVRVDIEDAAWQAFTWRGKVWGYPLSIEAVGLIYNKALVPSPPRTWDEVFALDKALAPRGVKAILWPHPMSFFSWPVLAGSGGYVFGRTPQGDYDPQLVGVNHPGAVAGAQLIERLVNQGLMPRGARYSDMEAQFAAGKVAMMISGPWAWDNVRKKRIDFGVTAIPALQGHPAKPFVGVLGCMVTAPSRYKDIAREFLENHLLKIEALKTISADVPLGTPANKAYYQELASDPHIRATMDNARSGEPIPNIPETGRFFPAMDAALEAITQGRQSPKEALDAAAARMKVR